MSGTPGGVSVFVWSDFQSAGGVPLGPLPVVDGVESVRLDGDAGLRLAVMREDWQQIPGADLGVVLRVTWPEGTVDEWAVNSIDGDDVAPTVALTAVPLFALLVRCGPITRVLNSAPSTQITGTRLVSEWCTGDILTHPGVVRLGLVLGTVESDIIVPMEFDSATPGQMLRQLAVRTGQEVEIVRTSNTAWTLHFRVAIGAALPALTLHPGMHLTNRSQRLDDTELTTVVVPLGDVSAASGARAMIARVRYRVDALSGAGPVRVGLFDVSSGRGPIRTDTQWVGAHVVWPNGTTSEILDSRASDSSVVVASTPGVAIGDMVGLRATATAPLTEVWDAASLAARGRRVQTLKVPGGRGERNELTNPRFASGLSGWSAANPTTPPAYAEVARTELPSTITGTAAARAAGTSTATPLALTIGANQHVRQQDVITIGGAVLSVTAEVVSNASGGLSIPVTPGLPSPYGNGVPFTLTRVETRTWTLDGTQSVLTRRLRFRDSNTDQLPRAVRVTLSAMAGGFVVNAPALADYTNAAAAAGPMVVGPQATGASGVLDPAGYLANVFAATCATAPTIAPDGLSATITLNGVLSPNPPYTPYPGAVANVTRVRWLSGSGNWTMMRVTAVAGNVLTLAPEDTATIPIPSTLMYNAALSLWIFDIANATLADGSTWSATMTRETRELTLSGSHVQGATTLVTTPVAAIATRAWLSTDTITLSRAVSGSFDITAVGDVTQVIDYDENNNPFVVGHALSVTFAAASSTMDEVPLADYPAGPLFFQSGTSGAWVLELIAGTTAHFFIGNGGGSIAPLPTGLVTSTWTKDDTYALTGTPAWANTGRVTLTLAAAVPAGRSYARGLRVRSNWHTGELLRLHAALSAGQNTVQVSGLDLWINGAAASSTPGHTVYRVMGAPTSVAIPGNTMVASASAQANGSGAVSVPITAANANAIGAGEIATIYRPALLRPTDSPTGSAVRLLCAVGGTNLPNAATPGLRSGPMPVTVPAGETRTVTAFVTFALGTGIYALGQQPAVALINADTGAILNTARTSDGAVQVVGAVTWVRLVVQATLAASTAVAVGCYGGAVNTPALWTVVLDAMLAETPDTEVPFIEDAFANLLAMRGIDLHAARRVPVPNLRLGWAELRRWCDLPPTTAPVALGQIVALPDLGIQRRVVQRDRSFADPENVQVEIGTVVTDLSRRVADLLATASAS